MCSTGSGLTDAVGFESSRLRRFSHAMKGEKDWEIAFTSLPPECLCLVLSHLGHQDICRFSRTCRFLRGEKRIGCSRNTFQWSRIYNQMRCCFLVFLTITQICRNISRARYMEKIVAR